MDGVVWILPLLKDVKDKFVNGILVCIRIVVKGRKSVSMRKAKSGLETER